MAEPGNRQAEVLTILAFAAGVAVGTNWPKIKKYIGPAIAGVSGKAADTYAGISKVFAEQQEKTEDAFAARKVRKVKPRAKRTVKVRA